MGAAGTEGEAALVEEARRDPAAFARLYRHYVGPLYRYLYSRVGERTDAEDLTTQVFTVALAGLPRYRERGSFAAWLFSIARRKVADFYRGRERHVPLNEALDQAETQPDPLAQVVKEERLRRLARLIGQLDDEKQELLRLRFAGDLTYREIGVLVGRSEAATKMAIHRLLRQLEAEWEAQDG